MSAATEKKVREAIEELHSQGVPITNKAVRDRLGSGSLSSIAPVVKRWKADQAMAEQVQLPDAIAAVANEAIKRIWSTAIETAKAEHEEVAAGLRSNLSESRRECLDFQMECEQLAETVEAQKLEAKRAQKQLATAEKKTAELAGTVKQQALEIERQAEQVRTLQAQLLELAKAKGIES